MLDRITALSDQFLTRLVPMTNAAAAGVHCWWETCGTACLGEECCDIPGRGTICKGCQWLC